MDATWYVRRLVRDVAGGGRPPGADSRSSSSGGGGRGARTAPARRPCRPPTAVRVPSLPPLAELDVDPAAAEGAWSRRADEIVAGTFEVLGVDPRRPGGAGLVPRPRHRPARPAGELRVRHPLPGRGRGRDHQADLGARPGTTTSRSSRRAYWCTGDETLRPRAPPTTSARGGPSNPFLSGVHWTSGIELGIRLISWTWIRRLLDDWPAVTEAVRRQPGLPGSQLADHQRYLAALVSTGSSANNHVIAEAAGQLVAATAFPWFADSETWATDALRLLADELGGADVRVRAEPRAGHRLPRARPGAGPRRRGGAGARRPDRARRRSPIRSCG